jgi:hypothetical protein
MQQGAYRSSCSSDFRKIKTYWMEQISQFLACWTTGHWMRFVHSSVVSRFLPLSGLLRYNNCTNWGPRSFLFSSSRAAQDWFLLTLFKCDIYILVLYTTQEIVHDRHVRNCHILHIRSKKSLLWIIDTRQVHHANLNLLLCCKRMECESSHSVWTRNRVNL